MLGKILIFVFVVLGMFGVLMASRPAAFQDLSYAPSYIQKQVTDKFDIADIAVYDNVAKDDIGFPYDSLYDAPSAPQWNMSLPTGQYLEVLWYSNYLPYGYQDVLEFRHVYKTWWWLLWSWTYHDLDIYTADNVWLGETVTRQQVIDNWDSEKNATIFYLKCTHIDTTIMFVPTNHTKTIAEAWDAGELSYYMTYEVNFDSMGPSAWTIVGQLIGFQSPDLGIPGIFGNIVNMSISFGIWAMIAYSVYKLITGLIPFLSGGSGD
jgi:hypothetical protein